MYDYLQIYDGPNETSSLLGRFCGKNLPGDLKGNSSQLTIQFSSDGTINKPGFCLHFFSGKKWELTFGKMLAVLTYNHLGYKNTEMASGPRASDIAFFSWFDRIQILP